MRRSLPALVLFACTLATIGGLPHISLAQPRLRR